MCASICCAAVSLVIGCGASSGNTGGAKGNAGGAQGGNSGTSGGSGAGGGSDVKPPHVVVPCNAAEVGKWEEITPPDVLSSPRYINKQGYGLNAMVMDPSNSANLTIGTDGLGIYRTTDCGATWKHINTGRNAAVMDGGTQWTMAVDQFAPDTIYTVSGYGTNGVFKTTNAGIDWDQALPTQYAMNFVYGGFTAQVRTDPTKHDHVVITPHFTCENGHSQACFLETTNGGTTWNVVENAPSGGEGARILVVDQNTWFSGVGFGGLFRTADAGTSWMQVTSADSYAYEVHHRPGGKYYLPAAFGVSQSDDGITWVQLDKAPGAQVVVTSDTHIYASTGNFCVVGHDAPFNPIASAPIDDPTNWTVDMNYSNTLGSGDLKYDLDHHILYTSNCLGGLWRVRTE